MSFRLTWERPMLKTDGIEVYIGDHRILRAVTLEVNEGERVAVLGANGAGKSTLIRSVTGLLKPRNGRILFQGADITTLAPQKIANLGLACVPEGRRPFKDMSVLDNLRMGAYAPRPRQNLKRSLEEVTTLFPVLARRLQQAAGTLSGGEQQMLAIGRALMCQPVLLLVDELSLGLGPLVVRDIYKVLTLVGQTITLLLVEQNVQQVLRHSDRAYLMETGRIVRSGSSRGFLEDPAIRASYLGH
jgi:branched-chain amino acid transport system ATP-binding protein